MFHNPGNANYAEIILHQGLETFLKFMFLYLKLFSLPNVLVNTAEPERSSVSPGAKIMAPATVRN
jgi:hypothetical protein